MEAAIAHPAAAATPTQAAPPIKQIAVTGFERDRQRRRQGDPVTRDSPVLDVTVALPTATEAVPPAASPRAPPTMRSGPTCVTLAFGMFNPGKLRV
ncbi:hypothetical protein BS50DRAFT_53440 [Corynespora cassiicola Philippines]|uniref:Uncharacterized protein n=1 Tax=Corynespora cassiicola Philippines TaxID=1448308 RepID=A0A2T2NIF2_CORCC|nr:hypothetical protein BS50DRAFT_53440 [Corynespora cassiicola Philippines]